MGFGPLSPNQPTWLGWTKPARVWVGQTDPAQPPLSPPLFLAMLWRTLIATTIAQPFRPAPVASAVNAWGETVTSTPSTPSSSWIPQSLPLRGDLWLVSPLGSAIFGRLWLDTSPSPLLVLAVRPLVLVMCVCTPVEALRCGAPGVLGEDYLGQPLAGRVGTALPCRPDEHLGDGECLFLLSTLLLLLWPWSLAIWPRPVSQAHRLILCSC
jgi:hypothetical protein